MNTTLRKLGNSTGLIIPSAILKSLDISSGDTVILSERDGSLIVTPEKPSSNTAYAFNSAINYAVDVVPNEADTFLRLWREGAWDVIKKEFPDFKGYLGE